MDEPRSLPQEILDKVLDSILDRASLKNCALASSSLLFRSQVHLFSEITINRPDSCKRLHVVLMENARLSANIRKPTLSAIYQWPEGQVWLSSESTIPLILNMVTSLRSFLFILDWQLEWKELHREVSTALFRLFALPSLSFIHLTCIYEIPTTFFNIPTILEHLTLEGITFEQISKFDSDSPSALSFKCLEVIRGPDTALGAHSEDITALALRPSSCFSHVTDLRISPSEGDFSNILPVLNAMTQSLTSIELSHEYRKPIDLGKRGLAAFRFDLAQLPNLRSFSLILSAINLSSNDAQDIISDLLAFLTSCADALCVVENLTIVLKNTLILRSRPDFSNVVARLSEARLWRNLDEAIGALQLSWKLRVNLVLSAWMTTRMQLHAIRKVWQELMRPQFPILEIRGALTVETEGFLLGTRQES